VVGKLTKPMSAIVIATLPLPPATLSQTRNKVLRQFYLPNGVTSFGLEFAFPFVNILTAVQNVPDSVGYRWFSDLALPFLQLERIPVI
jgi:hypothetical protein